MINGVGAAWATTQPTSSADKVALVQTAIMLPIVMGVARAAIAIKITLVKRQRLG